MNTENNNVIDLDIAPGSPENNDVDLNMAPGSPGMQILLEEERRRPPKNEKY